MQIFLMWPGQSDAFRHLPAETVARRLTDFFQPLFKATPQTRILKTEEVTIVYAELPVSGWKPAYLEQENGRWALSLDYMINAEQVLREAGIRIDPAAPLLPRLCQAMEEMPET